MDSIDGRELRDAFGQFATGVSLITTLVDGHKPMAITVNSFSSVSLEPALVLWSLQNDSDVYDIFSSAKYFTISVLNKDQEDLSTRYALKDSHIVAPEHFEPGKNSAPLIKEALVSFECEMEANFEGGDHLIILGKVKHLKWGEKTEPLIFHGGAYRKLS